MSLKRAQILNDVIRKRYKSGVRPRDAASLIILDHTGTEPRVLLGQRHKNMKFMPGFYVFPGGRVEPADHRLRHRDELDPRTRDKLLIDMKGAASPGRATGIALAAIRETFEEAGILIGEPAITGNTAPSPATVNAVTPANTSRLPSATGPWAGFLETGITPSIRHLTFIARAITPPGLPRRYDTRFFCVDAARIASQNQVLDDELEHLQWLTIAEVEQIKIAPITRIILEELADRLAAGSQHTPKAPVAYYRVSNGRFTWSQI